AVESSGWGVALAGHQPGPDAYGPDVEGSLGRAEYEGPDGRGDVRHGLLRRPDVPRPEHHLGRFRRRPRPHHPRRREDVGEHHAEGHAGVRPRLADRGVAAQPRDGVPRGHSLPPRRPQAVLLAYALQLAYTYDVRELVPGSAI